MTSKVVQTFKRRYEKNNRLHSLLINTSAMAAIVPVPFVSVYSATKIFGDFLNSGIGYEMGKYNVDCSTWRAAGVSTKIIGKDPNAKETEPGMATPD